MKGVTTGVFDFSRDWRYGLDGSDILVAAEDEALEVPGAAASRLPGESLTPGAAVMQAEAVFRAVYESRRSDTDVPWWEIVGPQVAIYCISKILRGRNIVRRIAEMSDGPIRFHCSSPILESLARDLYPSRVVSATRRRLGRADWRLKGACDLAGLWIRTLTAGSVAPRAAARCDVLLWCQNWVHEPVAFAVSDALVRRDVRAACIVERQADRSGVVNLRRWRDGDWLREVVRHLPGLVRSLRLIAEAVAANGEVADAAGAHHVRQVLERELIRRFVPRAADAWVIAGRSLAELRPASVLIQDETDYRTRALAIRARQAGVPVAHHHFGVESHECTDIEYRWSCADAECIWGDVSRSIMERLGIPPERLRVVGTPRLSEAIPGAPMMTSPSSCGTVMFPLCPASPLTFGNGGATSLAENRDVLQVLFRWAAAHEGTGRLLLKRRPLRDDRWADELLAGMPSNVEIVPGATPIADILARTDVVVTTHSTVAVDAIMQGIPLIVFRLVPSAPQAGPHPYAAHGMALESTSEAQLHAALRAVLRDGETRRKMTAQQGAHRRAVLACVGAESTERLATALITCPGRTTATVMARV